MPTTYAHDIRPKIRDGDIACMTPRGYRIGDPQWMCDAAAAEGFDDHGNARHVHEILVAKRMPPGAPWSPEWIATYQSWMDDGFLP